MAVTLQINDALFNQIDKELASIGVFHRMPALKAGLKAAGEIVEDRYRGNIPMPGYPGDKPGLKPLRDTLQTKVKEYGLGRVVAIVGAAYPAGAHAHLLEEGHEKVLWGRRTGGKVQAFHLLQKAVDATKMAVDDAVMHGIRAAIAEAKKAV